MMPKIKVSKNEWWPVYSLGSWGDEVELPQELIDRHDAALKEFNEVQDLIQDAYAAARKGGAS
jgi:hypothetical protein